MKYTHLIFPLTLLSASVVFAQPYSVSGRVVDQSSRQGVEGAVVTLATRTSVTDSLGNYAFDDIPAGEQILMVSHPNFIIDAIAFNVNGLVEGQEILAYSGKVLNVPVLKARKDTKMLCLDGCHKQGPNAWNASRENAPALGVHDPYYCAYAQVAMINHFYGGSITQDECAYYARKTFFPETGLGHGPIGAKFHEATAARSQALNNPVGIDKLSVQQPNSLQVKSYIDAGRPIAWYIGYNGSNDGHAMVVDGYRYKDGNFEMRFLNTDNNGRVRWLGESVLPDSHFSEAWIPPQFCNAKQSDPLVEADFDEDGVTDFDETYRWKGKHDLNEKEADTDGDGLPDGKDIEGWLFRGGDTAVGVGRFDDDKDGLRGEVDPDSDNGGVRDGEEDFVPNVYNAENETDPYAPLQPNADDIPKVKITLEPSTKAAEKTKVTGKATATFLFYRKDDTSDLRVFDEKAGPLTVKFTPEGGEAITVKLTPTGELPTATWTGELEITSKTPVGKAEFQVKNGASDVEIIEGKEFYISLDGAKSLIKE